MSEFDPTAEQLLVLGHDLSLPARVLAGPGTGKSATVVALIQQLLEGQPGARVRMLTFTRAATGELAKKIAEHVTAVVERPSTVHSFAISVLLRNEGAGDFPRPLRMADEWEQRHIVHETLARRIGTTVKRVGWLFQELAADWESLLPQENPRVPEEVRAAFQGAWQEHRRVFGYTLMAELPYQLLQALRQHDELDGLDYALLVVDEYQDLNACDLSMLKAIGDRGCSIIGAGDDDQSIYSFRRADPEGIRRFLSDYPGASDYTLSITQRCGRRIVEWAGYVILGDASRPSGRALPTPTATAPEGEVALLAFDDDRLEVRGVADLIENLHLREGIPYPEILILMHSDHDKHFSRPIREELTRRGIASADPDAVKNMRAESTNRRALATYRLLANRADSLAWAALFKLTPGIGEAFFNHLYARALSEVKGFGRVALDEHQTNFQGASAPVGRRAAALVAEVLEWLDAHPVPDSTPDDGWGQWMLRDQGGGEVPTVTTVTDELRTLLLRIDDVVETGSSLGSYLNQISPLGKDIAFAEAEGVRIMTMAGSKGLTVEATIVIGLENGIVPRADANMSEERRLLYVAMTRSKRFLYCTWSRRRTGPTAQAGNVGPGLRSHSAFLNGGPATSQNGCPYIFSHWPAQGG